MHAFDAVVQGRLSTNALECDVDLLTADPPPTSRVASVGRRVDRPKTATFRDRTSRANEIRDDHAPGSTKAGDLSGQVADRSGSCHQDVTTSDVGGSTHRVNGAGQRFRHRRVVRTRPGRESNELIGTDREELGSSAGQVAADELESGALRDQAAAALRTRSASDRGLDGHQVADIEIGDALTQLTDVAADLVALDEWWLDDRMLAPEDVHVGAADFDTGHPDQHLACASDRFRYLPVDDRTDGRHVGLLHRATS